MLVSASDQTITDADCVIFDCDGVLVDVSDSYYATIKETISHVIYDTRGTAIPKDLLQLDDVCSPRIIEKFKASGMFNDEVDLSCAIISCAVAAASAARFDSDRQRPLQKAYDRLVDDMVRGAGVCDGSGGLEFVISHLQDTPHAGDDVSAIISYMEHPSPDRTGRLCRIFNQIFFGSLMYRRMYGGPLEQVMAESDTGMIQNDHTLITENVLCAISEWLGRRHAKGRHAEPIPSSSSPPQRISMVTGRGLESVRHTLGPLLKWFDLKSSAFLEDEPREYAKPDPRRLDDCIKSMGSKMAIYVGDSVEDVIMAKNAISDVIFCGITGTAYDSAMRLDALRRAAGMHDKIIACDSVGDIPKALKMDA